MVAPVHVLRRINAAVSAMAPCIQEDAFRSGLGNGMPIAQPLVLMTKIRALPAPAELGPEHMKTILEAAADVEKIAANLQRHARMLRRHATALKAAARARKRAKTARAPKEGDRADSDQSNAPCLPADQAYGLAVTHLPEYNQH
jgi:hypothetical protein